MAPVDTWKSDHWTVASPADGTAVPFQDFGTSVGWVEIAEGLGIVEHKNWIGIGPQHFSLQFVP